MVFSFFILFGCKPTKHLKDNQFLLVNYSIIQEDKGNIRKNEFYNNAQYIKQKPNRKLFGILRFHLGLYNLVDQIKLEKRENLWKIHFDSINQLKEPKARVSRTTEKTFFGRWLLNIGEPPVIYDSILTQISCKQIEKSLKSKGYLNAVVTDSTLFTNKKVKVIYKIKAESPYYISKLRFEIEDSQLAQILSHDSLKTYLLRGDVLNIETLQKERDRITRSFNNAGFYQFSNEFIYFKLDTNCKKHLVEITTGIKLNPISNKVLPDSIKETPHKKFKINAIFLHLGIGDTLFHNGVYWIYTNSIPFRQKIISDAIFIHANDLYKIDQVDATYRRLTELRVFKSIALKFDMPNEGADVLNCHIYLSPNKSQSLTLASEGTNTGGDLGILGNISYQNHNVFHGAELMEIKLKCGLEFQQLFSTSKSNINTNYAFNTIEFGPEINLNIPHLLFWQYGSYNHQITSPKTIFSYILNYQENPQYKRLINKVVLGYTWKLNKQNTHIFNPLEISFVNATLNGDFQRLIDNSNNIILQNTYAQHLIIDSKYSYLYNNQLVSNSSNTYYFRVSIESAGNILRMSSPFIGLIQNVDKSYLIAGVPYAQYLKMDFDFRNYFKVSEYQTSVIRFVIGAAKPMDNLSSLPFEKSFYGGGSNDIRAWPIRTLGPGSFAGTTNFGQIGDMQIEANVELRSKIFKKLNGAVFIDAGNIWLLNPNKTYPGGNFLSNKFYKEFAIGSGVGLRLDFNFFILRFDLGLKVRDPQFQENQRWVIGHLFDAGWYSSFSQLHNEGYSFLNFNLGIGYPF